MKKKKWGNANDIFEFCILELCITQREGALHGKSSATDGDVSCDQGNSDDFSICKGRVF
jgi:hypothetical protein